MKKKLLMVAIFLYAGLQVAMAQSRPVKGRVLDETGEGLAGASITVKGTTTGTITDVDGNFSLDVPDEKKTLLINGVGYAQQPMQQIIWRLMHWTTGLRKIQVLKIRDRISIPLATAATGGCKKETLSGYETLRSPTICHLH